MTPFWVSAFLDFAPDDFADGVSFWRAVTGYEPSPIRGADGEFVTLVPPDGDDFIRVQRLLAGPGGIHVDLHVDNPVFSAEAAIEAGGHVVVRHELGYVVLHSPGGLTFCLVRQASQVRPRPTVWPGGHRSLVDQVCLDIPAESYDAECEFWRELTGWELHRSRGATEFGYLERPDEVPLRFLLQRLDAKDGPVRAHLDLATTDRAAETARQVAFGARVIVEREHWTALADPSGAAYCITDRDPETGMLP